MSEPTKHHYVPQIYLKRFSYNNSGDLFTLKHNLKYSKVVSRNKSQICYEKNRYKFDNSEIFAELQTNDKNIIEKNKFDYENFDLKFLFDKIDYGQPIFKSEFKKLVYIILNIKFRNPRFSADFINLSLNNYSIFEGELNLMRKQAINFCAINGIDPKIVDKAMQIITEKHKDINYSKNAYLKTILDETSISENFIEELLHWDLEVFQTEYNKPFITSDNPGYTVDSSDKTFNTNFGKAQIFAFPISPKSMFVLKKRSNQKDLDIYKRYKKRKAKNDLVLKFNLGTMRMANEMILSNLKEEPQILKTLIYK